METANITLAGSARGGFAALLEHGTLKAVREHQMRTNANLLRKQEWEELDLRLINVARSRLTGILDLINAGLTHRLGGLGTTVTQYEQLTDMSAANISMSGVTRGEQDDAGFNLISIPVPIIHKDFAANIRRLMASRKLGDSIDTAQGEIASRVVADGLENMLFNGSNLQLDGNKIYGYATHPKRVIVSTAGDWGTVGNSYTTILNMISALHLKKQFGPYGVYAATVQFNQTQTYYTDGSGQRDLDRIIKIPNVQFFKPSDWLTAGTAIVVQLTSDVVDLAIAEDMRTISWAEFGGMQEQFKVMQCAVPRVKYDADNNCGVAVSTGN